MARKSTRQSTNGTSSEAPGPGHNKPELTEDEQRALLYQHKRDYCAADQKVKDAKAELLRVCKLAKAECGKSAVADIKELIALEQPKGSEALQADIDRKLRLARWAGAKVGTQFTFEEIDRTSAEEAAFEAGKIVGLKGEVCRPPHDPSVPQHQKWIDGWHAGQAVVLSNFRDKLRPIEPAVDADQMDLAERQDLRPEPANDLSDPPFKMPSDDLDIRTVAGGALNRT